MAADGDIPIGYIPMFGGVSRVSNEFLAGLWQIAQERGQHIESVGTVIQHETGFDEHALNKHGRGAGGLLQWYGKPERAELSAVEQLPFIDATLAKWPKGMSPGDALLFNFLPAVHGKPDSFVIARRDDDTPIVPGGPTLGAIFAANFPKHKTDEVYAGDIRARGNGIAQAAINRGLVPIYEHETSWLEYALAIGAMAGAGALAWRLWTAYKGQEKDDEDNAV